MDRELLPSGTATSWRHFESETESETVTYVYEGPAAIVQGPEYLAEQLRMDGAASSLGAALSMSESAELGYGYLYEDEYNDEDILLDYVDDDLGPYREVITAKVNLDA